MQAIRQEKQLPRFLREFIGKGHELEQKKKKRRSIELEQRVLANRVLFLGKQQIKVQKSLLSKRRQLSRIMQIAQRQAHQKEKKERLLLERQKQIQISRQQNRLRRISHKQNQERSVQVTLEKNSLDYKISKKTLEQCEKRKSLERLEHLTLKKERYATLNLMRQEGRSRINSYFKDQNRQHTRLYLQKIKQEEDKAKQKLQTIKKLGQFEEVMRKRLQSSSLKASQMDQILCNATTQIKKRSPSRSSLMSTESLYNSPTLITSIESELLTQRQSTTINGPGQKGIPRQNNQTRMKKRSYLI